MNRPKVSVIVPSFNHEKYVTEAIQSVLDQSFQDFEIVVNDDGSTDRTVDAIASIKDERISINRFDRNYGVCISSNAAIRRARGEYLAFLCSDDIFLAGKLEKQVRLLDQNPGVGGVVTWPRFIGEDGGPFDASNFKDRILMHTKNAPNHAWLRHFFFHGNALCSSSLMIRSSCFDIIGLHNEALAQLADLELWVRIMARYRIELIEEQLVGFRVRDGAMNASGLRPEVIARDQWEWQMVLRQYLHLDDALLVNVFPELASRDGSDRGNPLRRLAAKALRRYFPMVSGVPDLAMNGISQGDPRRSRRWGLAELALSVGKPAHVLFAFETLYAMLPQSKDKSIYRAFINLTGAYDPFGSLFGLPANRSLLHLNQAEGRQLFSKAITRSTS